MSEQRPRRTEESPTGDGGETAWSPEERIDALERENARLREQYLRARQSQYRRAALGMAVVGGSALLGSAVFPPVRAVLLALGGTGLFGAVLTLYLTPETVIPADVGDRIAETLAANEAQLVSELGLSTARVYAPVPGDDVARLFVPEQTDYTVPAPAALSSVFVVPEDAAARGVALRPAGAGLFREFDRSVTGELGTSPAELAPQLTDALVEVFELADATDYDVDEETNRLTVHIDGSVYGPEDQFDHPLVSFVAVGLAVALDAPVETERTQTDAGSDVTFSCYWTERE